MHDIAADCFGRRADCGCAAVLAASAGARADLSEPDRPHDRAVRARRAERHHRAAAAAASGEGARPDRDRRQPSGRERHRRHRRGRQGCARRAFAAGGGVVARGGAGDQSEGALQHRARSRGHHARVQKSVLLRREFEGAGEDAAGVRRAREEGAGQVQLLEPRRRRPQSPRHRVVQRAAPASRCSMCRSAAARRRSSR